VHFGAGSDESPFPSVSETNEPPNIPVTSAAIGRNTAKTGPRRLSVTMMLSTPVCGVESRNAVVAPRLAPWRRRDAETGITPQEHSGNGTPKAAALTIDQMPRPPRWRSTVSGRTTTESTPATKNPKSRYGAISVSVPQNPATTPPTKSVI